MQRLTHKRESGMKSGYWSLNKKQELVDRLAMYEDAAEKDRFGKWIPCNERLPEKEDYFVITVAYKGSIFSDAGKYMIGSEGQGEFHPGIENFSPYSAIGAKVIAWMPLPEPYREEE